MTVFLQAEAHAVDDSSWYDFTTDKSTLRDEGIRFRDDGTAGFQYENENLFMRASALFAGSNGDEIAEVPAQPPTACPAAVSFLKAAPAKATLAKAIPAKASTVKAMQYGRVTIRGKRKITDRIFKAVLSIAMKIFEFF
jgi:hypothetical protein